MMWAVMCPEIITQKPAGFWVIISGHITAHIMPVPYRSQIAEYRAISKYRLYQPKI